VNNRSSSRRNKLTPLLPVDTPGSDFSRQSLACPLCGYSLFGLINPRCPECGYTFDWEKLLDARRRHHPYLFEHGRRQNIASFFKTLWFGQQQRKFWTELNPAMPVHWFRLVAYWLLVNTGFLAVLAVPPTWVVCRVASQNAETRSHLPPVEGYPGWFRHGRALLTEKDLDDQYPRPWDRRMYANLGGEDFWGRDLDQWVDRTAYSLAGLPIVLAWPCVSMAVLLVFRSSMRRAKVQLRHVSRAVLYSCDFALPVVLGVAWVGLRIEWSYLTGWDFVALLLVCFGLAAAKMSFAFRFYLRVHRPVGTVIASQVVVFMILFLVVIVGFGYLQTLYYSPYRGW
jgi:hypothetical protein